MDEGSYATNTDIHTFDAITEIAILWSCNTIIWYIKLPDVCMD